MATTAMYGTTIFDGQMLNQLGHLPKKFEELSEKFDKRVQIPLQDIERMVNSAVDKAMLKIVEDIDRAIKEAVKSVPAQVQPQVQPQFPGLDKPNTNPAPAPASKGETKSSDNDDSDYQNFLQACELYLPRTVIREWKRIQATHKYRGTILDFIGYAVEDFLKERVK